MLHLGKMTERHRRHRSLTSTRSLRSAGIYRRFDRIVRVELVSLLVFNLTSSNHSIADYDIGVIAPYHAQCLKIRAGLRGIADGVKVGSVEEFQGQVSIPHTFILHH